MLLSICIPTYNRAEYLQKTIESIVTQSAWNTGNTEIVISDNASTDSTSAVIAGYEKRYPGLIRSIRQDPAIDPHDNFEAAMRLGHGEYLKLNNDTLLWSANALAEYLQILRPGGALVLTPNSRIAPAYAIQKTIQCQDMSEMLNMCSYFLTWIGILCVRRDVFEKLSSPSRYRNRLLTQTDMILRLAAAGEKVIVDGRLFFESVTIPRRAAYQVAEIFCRNYFGLLSECSGRELSSAAFELEKKRMLGEYLIYRHFDFYGEFNSVPQKNYWRNTQVYHRDWYFYASFIKVAALWTVSRFFSREMLHRIKQLLKRW